MKINVTTEPTILERIELPLLEKIDSPAELKKLELQQLIDLSGELRNAIILQVATNGGHFAAPLGVVELTVALHYVYDAPKDKLVWDVGHQAYSHKLLTGRKEQFHTLKQYQGLSGFLKRDESEYDVFGAGHASTSISAALGIAAARDLNGEDFQVVAIVGDGALTGGLCYEGLNNLGHLETDMLIVLNDNDMSIDHNVGSMNQYLNRLISGEFYNKAKTDSEEFIKKLPKGKQLVELTHKIEEFTKGLVTSNILFEELGIRYFGPVDGHDLDALIGMLKKIKNIRGPRLLHVITRKGKGYAFSEKDPIKWHGPAPFKIESGEMQKSKSSRPTYTKVFADALSEAAERNPDLVAITAAMPSGTGLVEFGQKFPQRFFDVGIAEAHAVTFAAGLATERLHPVCAIYSTFLQRAIDQIIHDVALQNLPVVFALDRGGMVGADGPTHHGVFDFAYLRMIPNMVVMAPKDEVELRNMVHTAVQYKGGPIAFRYPRGAGLGLEMPAEPEILPIGRGEVLREGREVCLCAIGATVQNALEAARTLEQDDIRVGVANLRFVKPLDRDLLKTLARQYRCLITIEEHVLMGGFGSAVLENLQEQKLLAQTQVIRLGLPDEFQVHGPAEKLAALYGIHPDSIVEQVRLALTDKVREIAAEKQGEFRA